MTVRRDTKRGLKEDPGLFDQVLARMCGAWEEGEATDKPPAPWQVCRQMGMSYGALLAWVTEDEGRAERFDRMLKLRAHLYAEQTVDIADGQGDLREADVTRMLEEAIGAGDTSSEAMERVLSAIGSIAAPPAQKKLMIQARQWLASKWDRKKYGEHVTHDVQASLTITDAATELEMLERRLGLRAPVTIDQPRIAAPDPAAPDVPASDATAPENYEYLGEL